MKKLLTILIAVCFTVVLSSQVPEKMSYQAVVRNSEGLLVKNSPVGIKITIFSETKGLSFVETHVATTNDDGLMTLEIGGGNPEFGSFSTIGWSNGSYFLTTEIDPEGGTNYTITGTSQILTVPYALYSKTAETVTGAINETDPNAVLLSGDQTISGDKTFTGTTTVITPVNSNDAATKEYVDKLEQQLEVVQNYLVASRLIVEDYDKNIYSVMTIGTQQWMTENLKTTHYANGDAISDGTGLGDISGDTEPKYWFSYNDNLENVTTYGKLYTWYTITDSRNICPYGWHVPTDDEWITLENYLIANGYNYDGTTIDNKIFKALGSTTLWTSSTVIGAIGNTDYPNKRNATGFTALPGGARLYDGTYNYIEDSGFWWSNTQWNSNVEYSWRRRLDYNLNADISYRQPINKKMGFSVRCLRD